MSRDKLLDLIRDFEEKHDHILPMNFRNELVDGVLDFYRGRVVCPHHQEAVNELKKLMRDPRHWKEHDPEILKQIEAGFATLFPPEEANNET